MKNIRQWFRNAVLVLAGVMLLAACGNPAKSDLAAIAKVMVDEGRSIRDDFSQGIDKFVRGAKQVIAAPAQDSQAQEAASRLAMEGLQQFVQGLNKFMVAAEREGIKLDNK